jgi:hypothetical protein
MTRAQWFSVLCYSLALCTLLPCVWLDTASRRWQVCLDFGIAFFWLGGLVELFTPSG